MTEKNKSSDDQKMAEGSLSQKYRDKKVTFEELRNTTANSEMLGIFKVAEIWSKLSAPILILGETGVGKNMLAQAIHNQRKLTGFYEVNCTGISEKLFESELFGHVAGAFTGALKDRDGIAKTADGGTLFLDEIGDLSLSLQVKLLRLIDQKKFRPLGSDEVIETNIHIICATNKNLEDIRNSGSFRRDLFYRMPLCLRIPSLRERPDDSKKLLSHFFDLYKEEAKKEYKGADDLSLGSKAYALLKEYSWPGNARELKFVIQGAIFHALGTKKTTVLPEHLPEWIRVKRESPGKYSLKEAERKHIEYILDLTRGNEEQAAKILGISLFALYQKQETDQYKKALQILGIADADPLDLEASEKMAILEALALEEGCVQEASNRLCIDRRTLYKKFKKCPAYRKASKVLGIPFPKLKEDSMDAEEN